MGNFVKFLAKLLYAIAQILFTHKRSTRPSFKHAENAAFDSGIPKIVFG